MIRTALQASSNMFEMEADDKSTGDIGVDQ